LLQGIGLVAAHSGHGKLTKGKMKMTIDSHDRGSGRSYSQREEYAKADGKKRMSDEEFDKEMVELKAQLNYVKQLLQKKVDENHRQGWNVRKKVKWPIVHLFMKKLMHMMNVFIKIEKKLEKKKRHS
jgi:hypothetical protein